MREELRMALWIVCAFSFLPVLCMARDRRGASAFRSFKDIVKYEKEHPEVLYDPGDATEGIWRIDNGLGERQEVRSFPGGVVDSDGVWQPSGRQVTAGQPEREWYREQRQLFFDENRARNERAEERRVKRARRERREVESRARDLEAASFSFSNPGYDDLLQQEAHSLEIDARRVGSSRALSDLDTAEFNFQSRKQQERQEAQRRRESSSFLDRRGQYNGFESGF